MRLRRTSAIPAFMGTIVLAALVACGGGGEQTSGAQPGANPPAGHTGAKKSAFTVTAAGNKGGGEAVKIAVAGPMTGDQAKMGGDLQHGVELCVQDWNGKGGVLGKKIELLVGDDQHDPKQAVSVANKFINDGAVGVVGHFNSSCSIPASGVYVDAGLVMVTPASTNPQLTDQGLNGVFRVCGRDDQQGKVAAEYAANVLKPAKVAVLHDKTTYGQGLADEFKKQYETLAGKPVDAYEAIVQGSQDHSAVLTSIKGVGPDLIYFGGVYADGGLVVRQARDLGIKATFFSGDGVIDPEFIRIAGADAAEGTLLTFTPDQHKIAAAVEVIKRYEEKYGEVGPYSIYSYAAAQILLEGIQKAGGAEGAKVAEAIRGMGHETPLGMLRFDEKGDITDSPYVVWVTKGGKFEQLTGVSATETTAEP